RLLEASPEIQGPPGKGWSIPNTGDFNDDGLADMLWLKTTTNRMAIWLIRGTEVIERGAEIPGPPGHGWLIPSTVDFDGDGLNDVIWTHPDRGLMAVWLFRGTCLREPGPEIPGPPG